MLAIGSKKFDLSGTSCDAPAHLFVFEEDAAHKTLVGIAKAHRKFNATAQEAEPTGLPLSTANTAGTHFSGHLPNTSLGPRTRTDRLQGRNNKILQLPNTGDLGRHKISHGQGFDVFLQKRPEKEKPESDETEKEEKGKLEANDPHLQEEEEIKSKKEEEEEKKEREKARERLLKEKEEKERKLKELEAARERAKEKEEQKKKEQEADKKKEKREARNPPIKRKATTQISPNQSDENKEEMEAEAENAKEPERKRSRLPSTSRRLSGVSRMKLKVPDMNEVPQSFVSV